MSDNRRFVQLPHPGGEHVPDEGDWKGWNPYFKPHARKFLEVGGGWLESLDDGDAREGKLWAWAEWEAESRVLRRFAPSGPASPRYLWEPTWLRHRNYGRLHNTDPFIFDGFYYFSCKQKHLKGLKRLGRGSVIAFGSKKKPNWAVDAVLVVADYVDLNGENYEGRLSGKVPDCYWDTALYPTFQWADASLSHRWYKGATYDEPVDGMFSFFPCLPADQERPFPLPGIELPREYFTPNLAQSAKGGALHGDSHAASTIKSLWRSIAEQCLSQGLFLGIRAEAPAGGAPKEQAG